MSFVYNLLWPHQERTRQTRRFRFNDDTPTYTETDWSACFAKRFCAVLCAVCLAVFYGFSFGMRNSFLYLCLALVVCMVTLFMNRDVIWRWYKDHKDTVIVFQLVVIVLLVCFLFTKTHHCNNGAVNGHSVNNRRIHKFTSEENRPTPRSQCNSVIAIADKKTLEEARDNCNNLIAQTLWATCKAELDEQKKRENTKNLDDHNRIMRELTLRHTWLTHQYFLEVIQNQAMSVLQSADAGHLELIKRHASDHEYSQDMQITPSAKSYKAGVVTVQHTSQAQWQIKTEAVLHILVPIVTTFAITLPTVGGPIAAAKTVIELGGFMATVSKIFYSYKIASIGTSLGAVIAGVWDVKGWQEGHGTTFLNAYITQITNAASGVRCLVAFSHDQCIDNLDEKAAVSKFQKDIRNDIVRTHLTDITAFTKVMEAATKAICRQTPIRKQDVLDLLLRHNTSRTAKFYDACVEVLESKLQENRENWLTMGNMSEQLPMTSRHDNRRILSYNSVGKVEETCNKLSQSPVHVLQPWLQSHEKIIEDTRRVKNAFYDYLDMYDTWKQDDDIQKYKKYLDTLSRLKTCDPERLSALLHNASFVDIYRRSIPEIVVGTNYMDSDRSVLNEIMDRVKEAELPQMFASLGMTTKKAQERAMNIKPILNGLNATIQTNLELTRVQQERVNQYINVLPSKHVDIHGEAVLVPQILSTSYNSFAADSWLTTSGKQMFQWLAVAADFIIAKE